MEPSHAKAPNPAGGVSRDDAADLFGEALADAAVALVAVTRNAFAFDDDKERARRALLVIDAETVLGQLPTRTRAVPASSSSVDVFAAAVADLARYVLVGADRGERQRLSGLLSALLREAELCRPALEELGRVA